jgi:hypothetical protein
MIDLIVTLDFILSLYSRKCCFFFFFFFFFMYLTQHRIASNDSQTEKVLILEFMDAIHLNDLESPEAFGVDKLKLVEEIS